LIINLRRASFLGYFVVIYSVRLSNEIRQGGLHVHDTASPSAASNRKLELVYVTRLVLDSSTDDVAVKDVAACKLCLYSLDSALLSFDLITNVVCNCNSCEKDAWVSDK